MPTKSRLQTIKAVELLTLLERLFDAHGYYLGPEGQRVRCECPVCNEVAELFDIGVTDVDHR